MTEHIRAFALGDLLMRRYPRAAFRPPAYIAGTVQVEGVSVRRRVRCIERKTGRFIAETWSENDGSYRFDDLYPGRAYMIVAMDYALEYNAVVADNVVPAPGAPINQPSSEIESLLAPQVEDARYDRGAGNVVLQWRNFNHTQDAVHVYRSGSPIDPSNLPAPLAELSSHEVEFLDGSVVEAETYYYFVSAVRGGEEVVSIEIALEEIGVGTDWESLTVGDYVPEEGGYFTAIMYTEAGGAGERYALVTSPRAGGGTRSTMDWSSAVAFCQGVTLGSIDDFTLPTIDELIMCYRAFKPRVYSNNTSVGDTDKVDPPLGTYTSGDPARTSFPAFQSGGEEAFDADGSEPNNMWYWTSTESGSSARGVNFPNGYELNHGKTTTAYVRAVRRVYF